MTHEFETRRLEQLAARSDHPLVERALRLTFAITGTHFIAWGAWLLAFWLGAFGSLVLRARLYTGEWPHPQQGNPFGDGYRTTTIDPKVFEFHDGVVWIASWVLMLLSPFVILSVVCCLVSPSLRPSRRIGVSFVVLAALVGITWIWDPFGFMLWFVD